MIFHGITGSGKTILTMKLLKKAFLLLISTEKKCVIILLFSIEKKSH